MNKIRAFTLISVMTILLMVRLIQIHDASCKNKLYNSNYNVIKVGRFKTSGWEMNSRASHHHVFVDFNSNNIHVRHVTGNDKDYLRKIPRVVW